MRAKMATAAPFDAETLRAVCPSGGNIVLVEPYYEGTLIPEITTALRDRPIRVEAIGVPHTLHSNYGTPQEHYENIGLTPEKVRQRIGAFLTPV